MTGGHLFSVDLILEVGFRVEDLEGVLHFVEVEKFLDELKGLPALVTLGQVLHFKVFGEEGRSLHC